MRVHAVIDTNVLISSLITADFDSPTVSVIREIRDGGIIPIYSDYLLAEYHEVLSRSKFRIPEDIIEHIIEMFIDRGVKIEPDEEFVMMPDPDDIPIFLITMQTRELDSYLVTGNTKHYPAADYVVTPRRMIEILHGNTLRLLKNRNNS